MPPLVFVLLDGVAAQPARRCMSHMLALEAAGQARYTELECELPPLSRPAYATLFSGLPPAQSGILHNDAVHLCPLPTVFARARDAGLTTAAAAYFWISEVCNSSPYDPARHRLTHDPTLPIAHGLFYSHDAYPDQDLFHDAACLFRRFRPHLLLVHAMGADCAGHSHGGDSEAYHEAIRQADGLLARWMPEWLAAGSTLVVTSDHGMDAHGSHYDDLERIRRVPFWLAGAQAQDLALPQSQRAVAALMEKALGIAPETRKS